MTRSGRAYGTKLSSSLYEADLVTGALEALAGVTRHRTLVSSISVFASNAEPGANEDAAVVGPTDPDDYAHAKVVAERATAGSVGDRSVQFIDVRDLAEWLISAEDRG